MGILMRYARSGGKWAGKWMGQNLLDISHLNTPPLVANTYRRLSGLLPHHKVKTLSQPVAGKQPKRCTTFDEAVACIEPGDHIFLHHACSTPKDLLYALVRRMGKEKTLRDLRLSHAVAMAEDLSSMGYDPERLRSISIFIGTSMRKYVNEGKADYLPVLLSESSRLYDDKALRVDAAFMNLSPPDRHGFCSMGVSVDMSSAAARNAKRIIATINPSQPRTFGDSDIHISQIDVLVEPAQGAPPPTPIAELPENGSTPEEEAIGKFIAEQLVADGATIQLGIGSIPGQVVRQLNHHKDLGVHTELLSSGVVELVESGVVNNSKKSLYPGKLVTSFAMGTRSFYRWLDNNPTVVFGSAGWTNAVATVAANAKMTAINAAMEVDLTGQVVSGSIGPYLYSGFGGQLDYIYGSSQGHDGLGKPVIALTSRCASKGIPRIVPFIKEGAGVITTRAHVRYVVTEHGIAQLWGKTLRQRAYELIRIAHPEDREALEKAAFERLKCMPTKD